MNHEILQGLMDKGVEMLSKNKDFHLMLNEVKQKKYKLSDIGISTRVVSHWRKSNLLFKEEEKSSKNTTARFNLSELFWLKVIEKLSKVGVSISSIYNLKQIINKENSFKYVENNIEELKELLKSHFPNEEKIEEYLEVLETKGMSSIIETDCTTFDMLILIAILFRCHTGLLITEEGDVILWSESFIEHYPILNEKIHNTHLYISFNKILAEFGLNQKIKSQYIYTEQEKEIINQIREDKVSSVKVILKKNKPKSTQVEYEIDGKLGMTDLYLKHNRDGVKFSPSNGNKRKIVITKHNKL